MSTLTIDERLTSASFKQALRPARSDQHVLVTGAVADPVLVHGEPTSLVAAFERVGRSTFDVVIHVNAVDGLTVVAGEERLPGLAEHGEDQVEEDDPRLPERERRVRSIRRHQHRRADQEDVIATVRRHLAQCEVSVLVIVDQVDLLLRDPLLEQSDRRRVADLQLGLREAATVGTYRNTCVLIAGQLSSVPSSLLAGCEDLAHAELGAPTLQERFHHLRRLFGVSPVTSALSDAEVDTAAEAVARLTDGDSLRTLSALAGFSTRSQLSIGDGRTLVSRFRHGDRPDFWSHLTDRVPEVKGILEANVFGQPRAIQLVLKTVAAAALGLDVNGNPLGFEDEPRGILFFVGPTGVGKNEMARALALGLFGDPEAYVLIECSTLTQAHSVMRLTGAPPSYVGFEQGGVLTNAVRNRPQSVVIFDEVEKAHPDFFDMMLSLLDKGRLTDGANRTVDFSDCVVIFTSNIGATQLARDVAERNGGMTYEEVEAHSIRSVERHFERLERAELLGRLRLGIVAFDILRDAMIDRIVERVVAAACLVHGPCLVIDLPSTQQMVHLTLADPTLRALGGRQVKHTVRDRLRTLAAWIALHGHQRANEVRVHFEDLRMFVSVDGSTPVTVDD